MAIIFGTQMLLGSVCLMNVAYAAEPVQHAHVHAAQDEHAHTCAETSCRQESGMEGEPHAGCMSGDCYTSAYPSFIGAAGESEVQEVPAILSPLLTQVLLALGPTSTARSIDYDALTLSSQFGKTVLRE